MVAGERSIRIFGDDVPINAEVVSLPGMSAHADAQQIIDWLKTAKSPVRAVYVNHGEPVPADMLRQKIEHTFGWPTMAPLLGQQIELGA